MGIPTGTVTLLFTDIEGSTRLWEEHPGAMSTALQRHDAIVRSAIESAGGFVFKTVGDAFCAAFSSVKEAVVAAASAQRALHSEAWPEQAGLRVRMALHTGECEERNGDYFGPTVNRTARLEATAHGGQVVMSQATAALVRDRLPKGVVIVALGSHLLKDLDRSEDVFQLTVNGLRSEIPPLRSRETESPTNLTEPVTSLIGREAELREVVELLDENRMVTLTGSGGVGKTRLATAVGQVLLPGATEGVWLVELASVTDPSMVASEVLESLQLEERPGKTALESLVEVLAKQVRILILDNCEHLIEGCAVVADSIARHCPKVRLLMTSREPLRIDGEVIYRVPSLSLPPERVDDRMGLAGSGAAALFIERATTHVPEFYVADDNATLVASICRQLDGLPLAIELATARLRSMSLAELHLRLEHRFDLLTGGSRVAMPRQQTLRALVDWSYDLLTEPEQVLLQRASVFLDGMELEAVEAVCGPGSPRTPETAELLASLVEKSLLVTEHSGRSCRYQMIETIRQYGGERLIESGNTEVQRLRTAHAEYFATSLEEASLHLTGRSQEEWLTSLTTECRNLVAALEYLIDAGQAARGLKLFGSARRFWGYFARSGEALRCLNKALELTHADSPPRARAAALICKAHMLAPFDLVGEAECAHQAVEFAQRAGDCLLKAEGLGLVSYNAQFRGMAAEAIKPATQAVAIAREAGDLTALGQSLLVLGSVVGSMSELEESEVVLREAIAVMGQSGDSFVASGAHCNLANMLLISGRRDDARYHFEVALHLERLSAPRASIMRTMLAFIMVEDGDIVHAASGFAEAIRLNSLRGYLGNVAPGLLGLALCATSEKDVERAAILHGCSTAMLQAWGGEWDSPEKEYRGRDLGVLQGALGDDFEYLYSKGAAMSTDEVVKFALSGTDP